MKRWALAGAALLLAFIALGLAGEAFSGGPHGPESSSYATSAQGLEAWAELLGRAGRSVSRLRTPLRDARLDPAETLVVLDPRSLLPADGQRLLAFVRAGGRLVIGGSEPRVALLALFRTPPEWVDDVAPRQLPGTHDAVLAGIAEVRGAGEGAWRSTRGYTTQLTGADGANPLLLQRSYGAGTIELLADASPLQNRLLASADNAQLALDLGGPASRTVVFVESVHGFGESSGVAAIPTRWWIAFAGLALAGLAWALARGRRLGAAEPADDSAPPPRGDYVGAIALLLRRTSEPQDLTRALIRLRDEQ